LPRVDRVYGGSKPAPPGHPRCAEPGSVPPTSRAVPDRASASEASVEPGSACEAPPNAPLAGQWLCVPRHVATGTVSHCSPGHRPFTFRSSLISSWHIVHLPSLCLME
jgi:hypothetical protein